jgi:hypothetical protein
MYDSRPTENDPFGLLSPGADPFNDPPTPPAASAAGAPAAPQGQIDPNAPPQAPGFVPVDDFNRVKGELEKLKPLESIAWIGEAMAADPSIRARLQQALYSVPAAGAPPSVGPTAEQQLANEQARMKAIIDQKLAVGDISGAIADSAMMGAAIAQHSMRAQVESAAQPLLTATAQNTIESFKNGKRSGPTAALFAKIEPAFNNLIAQTPAATLADLAQKGQLIQALNVCYESTLAKMYESAYTKAAESGRLTQQRQNPPPYGLSAGGGPQIDPGQETDGDKDDAAFLKWAAENGISINGKTSEFDPANRKVSA